MPFGSKEDGSDGEEPEEIAEAAAGGRSYITGSERGRCDPLDRRDGGDVSPLAPGVRRVEERPGEAAEGSGDGECPASARHIGPDAGQADPAGGGKGKLLSPARRRACIDEKGASRVG